MYLGRASSQAEVGADITEADVRAVFADRLRTSALSQRLRRHPHLHVRASPRAGDHSNRHGRAALDLNSRSSDHYVNSGSTDPYVYSSSSGPYVPEARDRHELAGELVALHILHLHHRVRSGGQGQHTRRRAQSTEHKRTIGRARRASTRQQCIPSARAAARVGGSCSWHRRCHEEVSLRSAVSLTRGREQLSAQAVPIRWRTSREALHGLPLC